MPSSDIFAKLNLVELIKSLTRGSEGAAPPAGKTRKGKKASAAG